ncbi:unnamed protein product [Closterium sp. NIES-65]|nr:unnamed protein product [Closterium sp. NIES-65]
MATEAEKSAVDQIAPPPAPVVAPFAPPAPPAVVAMSSVPVPLAPAPPPSVSPTVPAYGAPFFVAQPSLVAPPPVLAVAGGPAPGTAVGAGPDSAHLVAPAAAPVHPVTQRLAESQIRGAAGGNAAAHRGRGSPRRRPSSSYRSAHRGGRGGWWGGHGHGRGGPSEMQQLREDNPGMLAAAMHNALNGAPNLGSSLAPAAPTPAPAPVNVQAPAAPLAAPVPHASTYPRVPAPGGDRAPHASLRPVSAAPYPPLPWIPPLPDTGFVGAGGGGARGAFVPPRQRADVPSAQHMVSRNITASLRAAHLPSAPDAIVLPMVRLALSCTASDPLSRPTVTDLLRSIKGLKRSLSALPRPAVPGNGGTSRDGAARGGGAGEQQGGENGDGQRFSQNALDAKLDWLLEEEDSGSDRLLSLRPAPAHWQTLLQNSLAPFLYPLLLSHSPSAAARQAALNGTTAACNVSALAAEAVAYEAARGSGGEGGGASGGDGGGASGEVSTADVSAPPGAAGDVTTPKELARYTDIIDARSRRNQSDANEASVLEAEAAQWKQRTYQQRGFMYQFSRTRSQTDLLATQPCLPSSPSQTDALAAFCQLAGNTSQAGGYLAMTMDDVEAAVFTEEPRELLEPPPDDALPVLLTWCSQPLYGELDAGMVWAWAEYHRVHAPVHRFLFYDMAAWTPTLSTLFRPYFAAGIAEITDMSAGHRLGFHAGSGPKGFLSKHQTLAGNDCIFRSLASSRWVTLHDTDEFLAPVLPHSLPSLLATHRHAPWLSHGALVVDLSVCEGAGDVEGSDGRTGSRVGGETQGRGGQGADTDAEGEAAGEGAEAEAKRKSVEVLSKLVFRQPEVWCMQDGSQERIDPAVCEDWRGHRKVIVNPRKTSVMSIHMVREPQTGGVVLNAATHLRHYHLSGVVNPVNKRCSTVVPPGESHVWFVRDTTIADRVWMIANASAPQPLLL